MIDVGWPEVSGSSGSSKRLGERLEGWPAMREERPQMDRVHHPEVKEKVIQVDEKVRDWMPSSGRELDGQAGGHRKPGTCRKRRMELPNVVSRM